MNADEILSMLSAAGVATTEVSADSRSLAPGGIFLAYPGQAGGADGRAHIGAAIERGARAVLWERAGFAWDGAWDVPNFPVEGLKQFAGPIAAAVFGAPSAELNMIGVTGTNGKTSVTQWIAEALERSAVPCGVIGTLGARFADIDLPIPNTTPDAIVLQRLLRRMRDAGAEACALEVSSIGLDQARVAGVMFDIAVFTNLTRDHLDYHGGMAAYESAKARLFACETLTHAVINIDDPAGVRMLGCTDRRVEAIVFGIEGEAADSAVVADAGRLIARALRFSPEGVRFDLAGDWGAATVAAPVWGKFNVSNLLAVIGALLASGASLALAVDAVATVTPVSGRMTAQGGTNAPMVVIDYAHTPDALEKVLEALRPVAASRGGALVAVFGCGGERDIGKRALMGAVAARLAERVIITSDNPRGEDPLRIIDAIAAGAPAARTIVERADAVRTAIVESAAADVVLIAGKGHETTQEIGGRLLPYSDHEIARNALHDRSSTNTGSAA